MIPVRLLVLVLLLLVSCGVRASGAVNAVGGGGVAAFGPYATLPSPPLGVGSLLFVGGGVCVCWWGDGGFLSWVVG